MHGLWHALDAPCSCRYRLGTPGAAKALLLFRKGWSALPQFGLVDRSAILVVGASMMPFSLPLRPKVWTI